MFVLEYVTDWENGESVINRFECKTHTDAQTLMEQAQYSPDGYPPATPHVNYSFHIEECS